LEYFENNCRAEQLGYLLSLTPTGAVWCNRNTPKIGIEYGWGKKKFIKAAIFLASLPMTYK